MDYDAIKRLQTTLANIEVQGNKVLCDDIEKLEDVLKWIQSAQPVIRALLKNDKAIALLEETA